MDEYRRCTALNYKQFSPQFITVELFVTSCGLIDNAQSAAIHTRNICDSLELAGSLTPDPVMTLP